MEKEEFKRLTGEDPEDVFGPDWENEVEKTQVTSDKFILKNKIPPSVGLGHKKMRIPVISMENRKIIKLASAQKKTLPKGECLNAEMFGRCFECEKIKGYNQALDDFIEKVLLQTEHTS